jgi:hypothetical protein
VSSSASTYTACLDQRGSDLAPHGDAGCRQRNESITLILIGALMLSLTQTESAGSGGGGSKGVHLDPFRIPRLPNLQSHG